MKRVPTFKLVPEPLDEAARKSPGFKWASKEMGTRHQLGGEPNFLQAQMWPNCPACRKQMTFYAQLDSISDEICIADCGMVYVFVCFDCFQTTSLIHSN
jgi:hypothetical protein